MRLHKSSIAKPVERIGTIFVRYDALDLAAICRIAAGKASHSSSNTRAANESAVSSRFTWQLL